MNLKTDKGSHPHKGSKLWPVIKVLIVNDKDKLVIEEGLDLSCPKYFGKLKRNRFGGIKIYVLRFQK